MQLQAIDWVVVAAYGIASLVIGLLFTKRAGRSLEQYFLSGRKLPWWLLGTSMVATTFSTDTPNLVTDMVRNGGVSMNWLWWAFLITGMLTVFFYAKLWRRSGALTDINFYELRYSGAPAAFLRGFRAVYLGVFFNIMIMATVTLAAIKIAGVLLGLDPHITVVLAALITMVYSTTAGLWGVARDRLLPVHPGDDRLARSCLLRGLATKRRRAWRLGVESACEGQAATPSGFLRCDCRARRSDRSACRAMVEHLVPWLRARRWRLYRPAHTCRPQREARHGGNALVQHRPLRAQALALDPRRARLADRLSELSDIRARFPGLEPSIIRHDLAYPAMLVLVPHGLLGLVVASLAAAYMSTISTHLNWGASYVVDDVYRRFIKPDASEQHYVNVGRGATVALMMLACLIALWLRNAMQAFQILLQIGAGTGLIFLLRWYWWRINAWGEVAAMVISFLVAAYLHFAHARLGFAPLHPTLALVIGVMVTTLGWLAVTLLTPPTDRAVLQSFYDKIRPAPAGWHHAVDTRGGEDEGNIAASFLAWFLGCLFVYATLFATGYLLYGRPTIGLLCAAVAVASAFGLRQVIPKVGFWTA